MSILKKWGRSNQMNDNPKVLFSLSALIYITSYQFIAIGLEFKNHDFLISGVIAMVIVIVFFINE